LRRKAVKSTGGICVVTSVAYPGIFFSGEGRSTNSVEDRGQRENGGSLNLQMNEPRILIRLLRMYIPRNWEFGSASAKLRNFDGGGG
jgi:hypothetical protein